MAREDARGQVVLVPLGDPPALPGRHKKFDSSGSPSRTLDAVSRQAHGEEIRDGREQKPKPYEVGVQIDRPMFPHFPAAVIRSSCEVTARSRRSKRCSLRLALSWPTCRRYISRRWRVAASA